MNDFKVTFIYGVKEFKPVEYTLKQLPNGLCELSCEFSILTGEYHDIIRGCHAAGIRPKIEGRIITTREPPEEKRSYWRWLIGLCKW